MAKYTRAKLSYKMLAPGRIQVPGFCNDDTYLDVVSKGAQGLGIGIDPQSLQLIVSNGLIRNVPLPSGRQWTLGNYTEEFGGVQARGKRTFGICCVPSDAEDSSDGDTMVRT